MAALSRATGGGRPGVAHAERLALCALLEDEGPLAPTLCEGWTTADLAAHLFVRESRPWAAAGIVLPPLGGVTRAAMDREKRRLGYEALVRRIRSGPPMPFRLIDEQVNTVEYFVHHEDVRRGGGADPGAREDPALDRALWGRLRLGGRFLTRNVRGVGLELASAGHGSATVRSGSPVVTMSGSPQELTLYLFGRKSAAHVELDGPTDAVSAVEGARYGL